MEMGNPQQEASLEWKRAYFGGLFDGEGCVTITKLKNRNPWLRVYIAQCERRKEVLFECQKVYGGKVYLADRTTDGHWRWYATDLVALKFLQSVLPYLYIKKQLALIAILFQTTKTAVRNCAGRWSYPGETTKFFEDCRIMVCKINQEGDASVAETERVELTTRGKNIRVGKYATVQSTQIENV